jgi:NADPH:quinone reductase-like Zn-dependent oxidoreductase
VWHLTRGLPYPVRLVSGLRKPKAKVPGLDLAGTVEAVGAGVARLAVGDEVFGTCGGAFAEYAVGREDRFARKPANLSFEQAAVVPVSACTALQSLRDKGKVAAGQRVLVIGACGGIGVYAVQLAKVFGAEVTAVCSTGKVDLVRSLGADHVVDYTREEFGGGFDLVLDIAGNRSLSRLRRALTPRGTLVIVGGEGGGKLLGGTDRQLRAMALSPFIGQRLCTLFATEPVDDLVLLAGLLESGAVKPVIDRTFPLGEAADAVRYLELGHTTGKSVLTV